MRADGLNTQLTIAWVKLYSIRFLQLLSQNLDIKLLAYVKRLISNLFFISYLFLDQLSDHSRIDWYENNSFDSIIKDKRSGEESGVNAWGRLTLFRITHLTIYSYIQSCFIKVLWQFSHWPKQIKNWNDKLYCKL